MHQGELQKERFLNIQIETHKNDIDLINSTIFGYLHKVRLLKYRHKSREVSVSAIVCRVFRHQVQNVLSILSF